MTVGGFDAVWSRPGRAAEGRDELLVHDLDHLLPGAQALRDVGPDRPLLDARDHLLDDARR